VTQRFNAGVGMGFYFGEPQRGTTKICWSDFVWSTMRFIRRSARWKCVWLDATGAVHQGWTDARDCARQGFVALREC